MGGTRRMHRAIAVLLICCAAAFALAAAIMAKPYLMGASTLAETQRLRTLPDETPSPIVAKHHAPSSLESSEESGASDFPQIDWHGLSACNPDAAAWVYVPGTRIDHPLVQAHGSDPQRYLEHDLYGSSSLYGCPYLDASCAAQGGADAPFVVAYGHSLVTGDMFSDFQRFSDAAYAQEHRRILFLTPAESRELAVVAANVVDANTERIELGFSSYAEAAAYVSSKLPECEVVLGAPSPDRRLYCFICCSYQTDNARTLVYAQECASRALRATDNAGGNR